jgi:hypothetical protein
MPALGFLLAVGRRVKLYFLSPFFPVGHPCQKDPVTPHLIAFQYHKFSHRRTARHSFQQKDSRDYLGDVLGYIQSKIMHPCWDLSPKSFLPVVCLGIAK